MRNDTRISQERVLEGNTTALQETERGRDSKSALDARLRPESPLAAKCLPACPVIAARHETTSRTNQRSKTRSRRPRQRENVRNMVEAPGIEPGSRKPTARPSTSVVCVSFLARSLSRRRDCSAASPPIQVLRRRQAPLRSKPVKSTPGTAPAGRERADGCYIRAAFTLA